MQVFRVEVAHRETGKTDVLLIEAATPADAASAANASGWLVSGVTEAPPVHSAVPARPTTPTAKRSASVTGTQILGGVMLVMAFVVFGFQVHGSSERAILWSARHGLRSQLHKFDDFVAVGATANDVKDLLSEVEGLRHELKESIDSFSNGALFWGGVVLLVLGTRRTTDKQ